MNNNVSIDVIEGDITTELNVRVIDITSIPSNPVFTTVVYDDLTFEEKSIVNDYKALMLSKIV